MTANTLIQAPIWAERYDAMFNTTQLYSGVLGVLSAMTRDPDCTEEDVFSSLQRLADEMKDIIGEYNMLGVASDSSAVLAERFEHLGEVARWYRDVIGLLAVMIDAPEFTIEDVYDSLHSLANSMRNTIYESGERIDLVAPQMVESIQQNTHGRAN